MCSPYKFWIPFKQEVKIEVLAAKKSKTWRGAPCSEWSSPQDRALHNEVQLGRERQVKIGPHDSIVNQTEQVNNCLIFSREEFLPTH